MTREAIKTVKEHCYFASLVPAAREALDLMVKTAEDFEALNAINLDLASENEDLVERIGKLIGYIDFLRNTAQGKKKSLNLLEKVVKGELEEIRAEGENFVKPKTEWIPVTEKLPENAKHKGAFCPRYYVMTEFGVTEGWYNPDAKYWHVLLWFMDEQFERWNVNLDKGDVPKLVRNVPVIAWMPLPEPYKGGQEE